MLYSIDDHLSREALIELHSRFHLDFASDLEVLSDHDFFAPQGDFWSPAEHLQHLIRCVVPLERGLRVPKLALWLRFGRASRSRASTDVVSTYLERLAGGVTASGGFAPTSMTATNETKQRLFERWSGLGEQLPRAIARFEDRDLDRYRLPHPVLGRLTVREMLAWSLYHGEHHRARIRERATEPSTSEVEN